jgi:hypothetical protein
LCIDSTWSCSTDTVVDDKGAVEFIGPEAGFLEIAGEPYIAENMPRKSPNHRIWYSFQPAVKTPKSKPLAVFFNGGPGSATSAMLFSFNTGTMTLDPGSRSDPWYASNPNNWTKFANLLYIDAPSTGFSYSRAYQEAHDIGIDIDRDAGIFLSVIVRFLARHPALQGNRIILVAESYGGTRATLMLNYLFNYDSLTSGTYQDQQVHDDLTSYFKAAFNNTSNPNRDQILTKFGHQVLIDPVVVGYEGDRRQRLNGYQDWLNWNPSGCAKRPDNDTSGLACFLYGTNSNKESIQPSCDEYNCDKDNNKQPDNKYWSNYQIDIAAKSLNNIATLNEALGVDARTIRWMHSDERTNVFGRDGGFSSNDMKNNFGNGLDLPIGDNYFVTQNEKCLLATAHSTKEISHPIHKKIPLPPGNTMTTHIPNPPGWSILGSI